MVITEQKNKKAIFMRTLREYSWLSVVLGSTSFDSTNNDKKISKKEIPEVAKSKT